MDTVTSSIDPVGLYFRQSRYEPPLQLELRCRIIGQPWCERDPDEAENGR